MSALRTDDHRWPWCTHAKRTLLEGGHEALFLRCSRMQLRNSFNFKLYAIKLENACRMYGVAMPTESEGYRAHNAMYDAEVAGRLYFAMRGIGYAAPN